jgi:hypothetical protein
MAELVANTKTSLQGEEVIVRAVQFFSSGKWRTQSQSARIATFAGRPPIPIGMLILTFIGFVFFIVPGIIMYFVVIRKMMQLQNIVVTVNPISGGSDVVVKYAKHAKKLVDGFLQSLPPMS